MLMFNIGQIFAYGAEYKTFSVDGFNIPFGTGKVIVYEGGENGTRYTSADYSFRYAWILTFDKNGKLIEGGNSLLADATSPQLSIFVPAGGFAVAFYSSSALMSYYNKIFDGVMIYNGTMPLIYDMNAEYNKEVKTLSVVFGEPKVVTDNTTKILFVGNSSTYYSGTPIAFEGLCRAAGLDVKVFYCTYGSSNLGQFADPTHNYGIDLRSKLKNSKYDYVVLQDASGSSYDDSDKAVGTLLELIAENGATPVLYMRYPMASDNAQKYQTIYTKLAEKYNIKVMPSAQAFAYSLADNTDINLYVDDNSHHSHAGSYLIACTWLYSLFDKTPVGNEYLATLAPDVAAKLQKSAVAGCDDDRGLFSSGK